MATSPVTASRRLHNWAVLHKKPLLGVGIPLALLILAIGAIAMVAIFHQPDWLGPLNDLRQMTILGAVGILAVSALLLIMNILLYRAKLEGPVTRLFSIIPSKLE